MIGYILLVLLVGEVLVKDHDCVVTEGVMLCCWLSLNYLDRSVAVRKHASILSHYIFIRDIYCELGCLPNLLLLDQLVTAFVV